MKIVQRLECEKSHKKKKCNYLLKNEIISFEQEISLNFINFGKLPKFLISSGNLTFCNTYFDDVCARPTPTYFIYLITYIYVFQLLLNLHIKKVQFATMYTYGLSCPFHLSLWCNIKKRRKKYYTRVRNCNMLMNIVRHPYQGNSLSK